MDTRGRAVEWNEDLLCGISKRIANRRRCSFIHNSLKTGAEAFNVQSHGRPMSVQLLTPAYRDKTARAWREIWYYSKAYREVFSLRFAQDTVNQLADCFIAISELDYVVALAGGVPLVPDHAPELLNSVKDTERAYYVTEVGRVPNVEGTRIGTFLFELIVLAAIKGGYCEFILNTAEFSDILRCSEPNPIRSILYEEHGFRPVMDSSGVPLRRRYREKRAGGQYLVDWRPYYHCTANTFLEKNED